jgi:hypothetical protein
MIPATVKQKQKLDDGNKNKPKPPKKPPPQIAKNAASGSA